MIVPAHTFIAIGAGRHPRGRDAGVLRRRGGHRPARPGLRRRPLITPRTAAILPVHLYGQTCDMDAVNAARPAPRAARLRGRGAGPRRHATAAGGRARSAPRRRSRFYPSKNLGALGDGGAICTDDERDRRARPPAAQPGPAARKGEHVQLGFNERLDGLQAALLRVKLRALDERATPRARGPRRRLPRRLLAPAALPRGATAHAVRVSPVPGADSAPGRGRRASGASAGSRPACTTRRPRTSSHRWRDVLEPPRVELSEARGMGARGALAADVPGSSSPTRSEQVAGDLAMRWAASDGSWKAHRKLNGADSRWTPESESSRSAELRGGRAWATGDRTCSGCSPKAGVRGHAGSATSTSRACRAFSAPLPGRARHDASSRICSTTRSSTR